MGTRGPGACDRSIANCRGSGECLVRSHVGVARRHGALITRNDNWKTGQQTQIEATKTPPTNDSESAIVADLSPGLYTAVVDGKGTSGIGLIEIYNLAN